MQSYLHFEQLRMQKGIGLHCVPTLLAGSLDSGWRMVFRGDFQALAVTKFDNFVQFAALYPEHSFVFIGDNGQGDVLAAAMMKEKLGPQLEAVFIKLCQPMHLTPGYTPTVAKQDWGSFHFFTTFVGAAVSAARSGLIHSSAVIRIASHAIVRLQEMKDVMKATEFDARRREMNVDLVAANSYLTTLDFPALALIRAENSYPIGAHVWTPFGPGEIVEFEPYTSIYVISILHWTLADGSHPLMYQHTCEVELIVVGQVGSRVWTPYGTGVVEAIRASGSVHSIALTSWGWERGGGAGRSYAKAYLQASECFEILAAVGELVYCHPFGYGQVVRYRAEDEMYEVELRLSGEAPIGPDALRKSSKGRKKDSKGVKRGGHESRARSVLYTTGRAMRRVDEEEKKQRSCVVM